MRREIPHHDVMNSGQELGPAITRGSEPVKSQELTPGPCFVRTGDQWAVRGR